jgi:hypothetical protein
MLLLPYAFRAITVFISDELPGFPALLACNGLLPNSWVRTVRGAIFHNSLFQLGYWRNSDRDYLLCAISRQHSRGWSKRRARVT